MPSTYTGAGIELIANGEQSGTWGDTTNDNLAIIDRLTSQAGTISLSGTTHTLTISDGTLSDGQYAVLVFGGSPTGTNTVTISPNDAKRVFIVRNVSGESVVLTQGSGGNVTVANGDDAIVYCDGGGAGAAVVDTTDNYLRASNNLSDLANAGTARTNLGVAIGTNVQAWDANLDQLAALAVTDGNFIVGNGSAWVAESGATARTSLGVAIGTNVQAWDVNLDQIAALAVTDGNFIVGNGSAWVAESGATARTSLGLGTAATSAATDFVAVTGDAMTGNLTFGDSNKVIFGAGSDLEIYHDGSNSYVSDVGTGSLRLQGVDLQAESTNGDVYFACVSDGAVTLYYDNGAKIATTSTGISVTGTALATTDTDTSNTGSVTLDFGANQNFVLTLTGNVTLANPTTEQVGQSGFIVFIQDATGGRTVSLGTDYETAGGAGLTLSSAASATDIVPYVVAASGRILLGTPQLAFS